jgi:CHAT domain-containing protein
MRILKAIAAFGFVALYSTQALSEDYLSGQATLGFYTENAGDREKSESLRRQISGLTSMIRIAERTAPLERRSEKSRLKLAELNIDLGKACFRLYLLGTRAMLECAQHAAERALKFANPRDTLSIWADGKYELVLVLQEKSKRNDPNAYKEAIAVIEELFARDIRYKLPIIWARSQAILGMLLVSRRDPSDEEIARSLSALSKAQEVFTEKEFPQDRVLTQMALRNAQWIRIESQLNEQTKRDATSSQKIPLRIITGKEHPAYWAWLYGSHRTRDPESDAGQEIGILEAQLKEMDAAAGLPRRVTTHLALAEAYLASTIGSKEVNFELAEKAITAALKLVTPKSHPLLWGTAHGVLGIWVASNPNYRTYGERAAEAVGHFSEALKYVTQTEHPFEWAVLNANLAGAFLAQPPGQKSKATIRAADLALSVLDPKRERELEPWIVAMRNKALAHQWEGWMVSFDLKTFDEKVRLEQYTQAVDLYEQVLSWLSLDTHPEERLRILADKIQIDADRNDWLAVTRIGEDVLQATDAMLKRANAEEEVRETISAASPALSFAAYAALRVGKYQRAMELLERTRAVVAQRTLQSADSTRSDEANRALKTLQDELLSLRGSDLPDTDSRRQAIRSKIFRLRATTSVFSTDVVPPQGTAILTMVTTRDGGGVLLRTTEGYAASVLPPRSYPVIAAQFFESLGQSSNASWEWGDGTGIGEGASGVAISIWTVLEQAKVPKGTRIIWIPPVHLANIPIEAGRHPETGEYLLDRFQISTAPSISFWQAARERARTNGQMNSVAGIFNPTRDLPFAPSEEAIIANTAPGVELQTVPSGINSLDLLEKFKGHTIWHFATHHHFNWSSYLESGLELGRDVSNSNSRLTLEDLFYIAPQVGPQLVLLTVCESGLTDVKHYPDEVSGMSTAFLQIGASGVISARWNVSDLATVLTVAQFYLRHLGHGMSSYPALRQAQLWLRDATREELFSFLQQEQSTMQMALARDKMEPLLDAVKQLPPNSRPFADPKYWAAFNYQGAAPN